MNDELSPEARRLIDAAGSADLPDARDRTRVRAKVALSIAGAAAGSQAGNAAAQHTATTAAGKVALGALGSKAVLAAVVLGAVGIGIGALGVSDRSAPSKAPATATAAKPGVASTPTVAPSTVPGEPAIDTGAVAPSTSPSAHVDSSDGPRLRGASTASRATPRTADHDWAADLQAEVTLLSQAQRALANGKPDAALEHLAQHRARFPRGALAQERLAATAIAHCEAGRHARGRALLTDLPDESPLSARAIEACRSEERSP